MIKLQKKTGGSARIVPGVTAGGFHPCGDVRRLLKHPPYGGVCILLRLTVAVISYADYLEESKNTEKYQIFRKPPFRVFVHHVGLTVATFSVAHVGVLGSLSHPYPFVNGTLWASFLRAWDCGVLAIVLCVIRGLEPSLLLLIAISSQVRQRPHYYFVTLLSRLISSPVRLLTRYLLHLSYNIT